VLAAFFKDKSVFQKTHVTLPPSVRVALLCLWLSTGILVLLTIAAWANLFGLPNTASVTVNNLLTLVFMLLVIVKLAAGRGWARWVFAVVYFLGSSVSLYLALFEPQIFRNLPLALQATGLAQLVLQTAAMALLLLPTARQWFRAQRAQAK
jgi:glucan phosphoethanolaminetransferase (alkaline phosphatase superfamily)